MQIKFNKFSILPCLVQIKITKFLIKLKRRGMQINQIPAVSSRCCCMLLAHWNLFNSSNKLKITMIYKFHMKFETIKAWSEISPRTEAVKCTIQMQSINAWSLFSINDSFLLGIFKSFVIQSLELNIYEHVSSKIVDSQLLLLLILQSNY